MTPALEMRGVAKRFGPTHALRGVDLELREGEIHALVQPRGHGDAILEDLAHFGIREGEAGREQQLTIGRNKHAHEDAVQPAHEAGEDGAIYFSSIP